MNWFVLIFVAWIGFGFETALLPVFDAGASGVHPSVVLPLLVFVALYAPRKHALWCAIILGISMDLLTPINHHNVPRTNALVVKRAARHSQLIARPRNHAKRTLIKSLPRPHHFQKQPRLKHKQITIAREHNFSPFTKSPPNQTRPEPPNPGRAHTRGENPRERKLRPPAREQPRARSRSSSQACIRRSPAQPRCHRSTPNA